MDTSSHHRSAVRDPHGEADGGPGDGARRGAVEAAAPALQEPTSLPGFIVV